jgi:predicted nuclease of restriction endonuclease-like RecB superfamily
MPINTIPDLILFDDPKLIVDIENKKAIYAGKKLSCKRKFEIKCKCGKVFSTTLNYFRKKKNIGFCRSCSSKISWKDQDYRDSHEPHIKALGKSEESKKRGREQFLKMWKDPVQRDEAIKRCHSVKAIEKLSKTLISKLANDDLFSKEFMRRFENNKWGEHYEFFSKNKNHYHLKSRGELRIAKLLDHLNIDWEYEPKRFLINSINRVYYPDFHLTNENIWIEVKFSKKQDTTKFFELLKQEDMNLVLLFNNDINMLEKECELKTSKMILLEKLEILRSKIITTL